jgi:DNA-binding NtrC family response regulator
MDGFAKILVVDDDIIACELLTEMLHKSHYDVDYCQDARRALQKISEQAYDLVVTDLKMPKTDGMELLRAVKQASEHTQVILISAFGDETKWVESLGLGAYDFIPKPFKKKEILEVVRDALLHRASNTRREENYRN